VVLVVVLLGERSKAFLQWMYGHSLENGIGVPKNMVEAAGWYDLSVGRGHARAQFDFARCLEFGIGIQRTLSLVATYYKLAVDQGLAEAQCHYGRCLENGTGIRRESDAARYYRLSGLGMDGGGFQLPVRGLSGAWNWDAPQSDEGCARRYRRV
jgi:TPR repeat protein